MLVSDGLAMPTPCPHHAHTMPTFNGKLKEIRGYHGQPRNALLTLLFLAIQGESGVVPKGLPNPKPIILNDVLGTKFKLLTGYVGTQETILAIERGEAHGRCVFSYSALKIAKPDWLRDKKSMCSF
jgi:hypothetical protein